MDGESSPSHSPNKVVPEGRLAYLYRPGERIEVRDESQSLDNGELLPGFSVALSAIFGS